MTQDSSFSIAELARRCAKAMARRPRQKDHDLSSCYELFRHALQNRDRDAWSALYDQYHRMVRRWLGNPPGDPDDLVNEAFARFWRAIPAERFDHFPTTPNLLA
ncbi:MAG: sigma factor, partial [Anaerolineae bacterium]